jgi:hypothetical protein
MSSFSISLSRPHPSHFGIIVAMLMVLGTINRSDAGDRCCVHCGCQQQVTKVCRIVKVDKKITVTCWGAQDEEFLIGDPSTPGQEHCETVCTKDREDKLDDKVCSEPKALKWTSWIPGKCATVFTKTKLMKKTVTKTIPSYKWVIEDVCAQCKAAPPAKDAPVTNSDGSSKKQNEKL